MSTRRLSMSVLVFVIACMAWWSGCSETLPERAKEVVLVEQQSHAKQPTAGKKALLVHSYHSGYSWVDAVTRGVQSGLANSGVELDIFYMDTKRQTDEPWKVRAGELAMQKVKQWAPDVIITADDNAQQYFGRQLVDGSLPLVFCGVNAEPSQYGYPATNVTGVIERPFFKETLVFLQEIRPIRKVAVLSCEDNTSRGAVNFIKEQSVDCEVETRLVNDFDEWKLAVEDYNGRVDALGIYMYHTVKERGKPMSLDPKLVIQWTVEHSRIPTMGYFDFGVEDGLLLGVVESGKEQGERAAHCAVKILSGVVPRFLPVCRAEHGKRMFNVETGARLGITLPDELRGDVQLVPAQQR